MIYNHLKVLELYQVSFEDMKEIYVVLRLILSSPNLEQLLISVSMVKTSTSLLSCIYMLILDLLKSTFVFPFLG